MRIGLKEYQHHLKFLYNLQFFGIKLGLENIRALVNFLDNPHLRYPVIHIAGTNGKGSTAAMIAAVLTSSGYRTGLYTSPHLVNFNERIRINGVPIPEAEVGFYTKLLKREILRRKATFFEATTAMAFKYFADCEVDVAVIETGLGGRFDATNVVEPVLSVISSIGIDHVEHLGNSLSEIAYEKGGIIKADTPCVIGCDSEAGYNVLKKISHEKHSKLIRASRETKLRVIDSTLKGSIVDFKINDKRYRDLFLSLAGEFQAENTRTALLAVDYLIGRGFSRLNGEHNVRQGLGNIAELTGLRGRMDMLKTGPLIIMDVAHNPSAIERLCSTISKLCYGEFVLVFGLMKDKDIEAMLSPLSRLSKMIIAVQPRTDRALKSCQIVAKFHAKGHKAVDGGSVEHGIEFAFKEVHSNSTIVALGSHYVVGETMKLFLN